MYIHTQYIYVSNICVVSTSIFISLYVYILNIYIYIYILYYIILYYIYTQMDRQCALPGDVQLNIDGTKEPKCAQ